MPWLRLYSIYYRRSTPSTMHFCCKNTTSQVSSEARNVLRCLTLFVTDRTQKVAYDNLLHTGRPTICTVPESLMFLLYMTKIGEILATHGLRLHDVYVVCSLSGRCERLDNAVNKLSDLLTRRSLQIVSTHSLTSSADHVTC